MAGTDMGSRTGFQTVKPAFVNMGGANPTKPNFVLRGSSYVPRSNLPAVIPTAPTGIVSLMSRFPKTSYLGGAVLGTGIGLLTDAYQKSTKTPLAYKKLKEVSSRPYYFDETNIDVGEGLDEIGYDEDTGKTLIVIDSKYFRPTEVDTLLGDSTKAMLELGWKYKYDIKGIIKEMIDT